MTVIVAPPICDSNTLETTTTVEEFLVMSSYVHRPVILTRLNIPESRIEICFRYSEDTFQIEHVSSDYHKNLSEPRNHYHRG